MKIMILGSHGQLGTELTQLFSDEAVAFPKSDVDICSFDSIVAKLKEHPVDCVINAAAYNRVDQAEDEPQVAYAVNALGPRNLAIACSQFNIRLVHISSDYVFGGSRSASPWTEADCPEPVSAYGVSKLAGECFVRALAPKHFVLRTCGLYGHAAISPKGERNFVETMLKLAETHQTIRVVDDQYCTPTSTSDLAVAISRLIQTDQYGLYHATNSGECTWAQFAQAIFRQMSIPVRVVPIRSDEYANKAIRPAYSLLNCNKINEILPARMPHWHDALADYLTKRDV